MFQIGLLVFSSLAGVIYDADLIEQHILPERLLVQESQSTMSTNFTTHGWGEISTWSNGDFVVNDIEMVNNYTVFAGYSKTRYLTLPDGNSLDSGGSQPNAGVILIYDQNNTYTSSIIFTNSASSSKSEILEIMVLDDGNFTVVGVYNQNFKINSTQIYKPSSCGTCYFVATLNLDLDLSGISGYYTATSSYSALDRFDSIVSDDNGNRYLSGRFTESKETTNIVPLKR